MTCEDDFPEDKPLRRIKRTPTFYVAAAMTAATPDRVSAIKSVIAVLKEFGTVASEHVGTEDPIGFEREEAMKGVNVYARDFKGLDSSIAVVADISIPTTGGGAEIDYAVRAGIPTLVTFDSRCRGSWYITQWPSAAGAPPNLTVQAYESLEHQGSIIRDFAKQVLVSNPQLPGAYVVIEGGEGSGKTVQRVWLGNYLKEKGFEVVVTREPGGTERSEEIRKLLLSPGFKSPLGVRAELLLFEAARAQLVDEVIIPALKEGKIAITDRNYYSTDAYQGAGRGLGFATIDVLNHVAMGGLKPDLGFIIDCDPRVGHAKATSTANTIEFGQKDRIEAEKMEFFERVRQGYLDVASREPRVHVIPHLDGQPKEMQSRIQAIVDEHLLKHFIIE